MLGVAGDFVAEVLDRQHGAQVTDSNIFRQHAAKYVVSEGGGERVCVCVCMCTIVGVGGCTLSTILHCVICVV